jgi:hypothetical protein
VRSLYGKFLKVPTYLILPVGGLSLLPMFGHKGHLIALIA